MPWRKSEDPYQIAVAEILLQQTRGEDVVPVWEHLVQRFPMANDLAQADVTEVTRIVGHLGLGNQRTLRLKAMASSLADRLPQMCRVPGLGTYGLGMVLLAIGIEPPEVPVDGNIARVLCRYFGLKYDRGEPRKKREVRGLLEQFLLDCDSPSQKLKVIYSLVDMGSRLCVPRRPLCKDCPLSKGCMFA